jgi:hypothetical protein
VPCAVYLIASATPRERIEEAGRDSTQTVDRRCCLVQLVQTDVRTAINAIGSDELGASLAAICACCSARTSALITNESEASSMQELPG